MYPKISILAFVILISSVTSSGQNGFTSLLTGGVQSWFGSVSKCSDGGFFSSGTFVYNNSGGNPPTAVGILLKADSFGNVEWLKGYGSQEIYTTIQLKDNSIAGISGGVSTLFRMNDTGLVVVAKTFSRVGLFSLKETSDGGLIACGRVDSTTLYSYGCVIRTNNMCDTIWTRTFHETDHWDAVDVVETRDSGFIVIGWNNIYGVNAKMTVVKLDANGQTVWMHTILGTTASKIIEHTHDTYVIYGLADGYGNLIKIDSNGNLIWSKGYRIDQSNQYFVGPFLGITSDYGFVIGNDEVFIRTDSVGNSLWSSGYPGITGVSIYNTCRSMCIVNDDSPVFAGYTYPDHKAFIIKTDTFGTSGCNNVSHIPVDTNYSVSFQTANLISGSPLINASWVFQNVNIPVAISLNRQCTIDIAEADANDSFSVFPVPFTNALTLKDTQSGNKISICDLAGRIVYSCKSDNLKTEIRLDNISGGIYILNYSDTKGKISINRKIQKLND